ncbi:MAG: S1C family serine protease [Spirochaetaceae bacterium]|jgi:S1-C subfamily serine protease|nr:S1C family serine protease [Spirochaetaceae bacterium]
MNKILFCLTLGLASLVSSCASGGSAESRLLPLRSAVEVRLADIERLSVEDPARAIHLIGVCRNRYGPGSASPDLAFFGQLPALESQALDNLKAAQSAAIEEMRWDDAASCARSLAALGVSVASTGMEPDLILAGAKEQLAQGNDLAAFLGAVRSHAAKPLSREDALLFLERAAGVGQRRTAFFFLQALIAAGGTADKALREYAEGRDSPDVMIGGVATVLVDRGYRIERGMGLPDRVLGSAFFVDASGLLITNYHVISSEVDPSYEGFSRMYIRMGDSASPRIPARVLGWDQAMDLALIKAELRPDYVFSVVDRVLPRVGDTVNAIGSPVGLEKTVTRGIVSATGRRFLQVGDVIQIDAAVNQGNSGGPVVDMDGRLVGIVFAGIAQYQGLNFAVPAERLAAALPAMLRGGRAQRPWLGLTLAETVQGAEIVYVVPGTPAAEQQIPEGALIRRINGVEISAPQGALIPALQDSLFSGRPGELVSLETASGERRVLITAARPDVPLAAAARMDTRERLAAPLFGMILSPSPGGGVFSRTYQVRKVVRGSVADEMGLSEQDPITIRAFRVMEKDGYALLDINVKKRRMGFLETTMRLPAALDSPDTL